MYQFSAALTHHESKMEINSFVVRNLVTPPVKGTEINHRQRQLIEIDFTLYTMMTTMMMTTITDDDED